MRRYCLGFLTNEVKTKVALIRKERPAWQAGYWNGIGGKVGNGRPDEIINLDEEAIDAMPREFEEETGVYTGHLKWKHLFHIESEQASKDGDYILDVFTLGDDYAIRNVISNTDEKVEIFNIWDVNNLRTTPNVLWFCDFIRTASNTFKLPIFIKDVGGY